MEALEVSHSWAGGLSVPARYVLTGEDLCRKRSRKKSPAVAGLCRREVSPGCSPSSPCTPRVRKPGLSRASDRGRCWCFWAHRQLRVQVGPSGRWCSWECLLQLWPGLWGKLQSEVPFISRPGPLSVKGAGARLSPALHREASSALLPHTQMSWDTTVVAL